MVYHETAAKLDHPRPAEFDHPRPAEFDHPRQATFDHHRRAKLLLRRPGLARYALLPFLVVALIAVLPLEAENSQNSGPARSLLAELSPRIAESGFADLAISKARGLERLADSATVISELIVRSTKAADIRILYVELASIQELLGRYEEAANSWEAAIAAQPGQGETDWLLSAAACRLAIGDADSAAALAKAALLTTAIPGLIARALLIEARALLLAGDSTGALARAMDVLATGASGFEAAALSLARDVSSGAVREGYEKRLREEHPGRLEAHDALALIYSLVRSDPPLPIEARIPAPRTSDVPGSVSSLARPPDLVGEVVSSPLYYQLGAFRDEANAALLSTRLVRAGFKPKTVRRESRAGVLSIVYLEAGADPARLMIALKDAGFESWPLFAEP
jgi:tetratricopeptide (TPR) repeat protein